MTAYLLHTNVLSEIACKRPNPAVVERARAVPAIALRTSAVCVMELRFGAMRRTDGAGQHLGTEDAQIGGTALSRGLVLVTANVRHFSRIAGLRVEDWTASSSTSAR
jgi:predicted nucleic acid-binding protein